MAEYIEREASCKYCFHYDACFYHISEETKTLSANECPLFVNKADVVEVRHAQFKWGYQNGQYGIWCTICGAGWVDKGNAEWIAREHNYCPNCGAKMDGATDTNVGGKDGRKG